ncbi:conserved hypothetical protein [Ricinus communis]|uniref:Uncharacterized protein n=1 Tax=Ricinus communis TaxID=3988 RepID=B9TDN2_RICCO|nr:conserved hypothetical protein [Ricinus communis]
MLGGVALIGVGAELASESLHGARGICTICRHLDLLRSRNRPAHADAGRVDSPNAVGCDVGRIDGRNELCDPVGLPMGSATSDRAVDKRGVPVLAGGYMDGDASKLKRLELLGGVGAGIPGAGAALLFARWLLPYAVPVLIVGLVTHEVRVARSGARCAGRETRATGYNGAHFFL